MIANSNLDMLLFYKETIFIPFSSLEKRGERTQENLKPLVRIEAFNPPTMPPCVGGCLVGYWQSGESQEQRYGWSKQVSPSGLPSSLSVLHNDENSEEVNNMLGGALEKIKMSCLCI